MSMRPTPQPTIHRNIDREHDRAKHELNVLGQVIGIQDWQQVVGHKVWAITGFACLLT